MIDPIILSDTRPDEAQAMFNHWLTNEPVTLLVILGNNDLSLLALDAANKKINSGSGSYTSVRSVHARKPEYIKSIISQLHLKPDHKPVNWDSISDYVLLSISNMYNNIGLVVTRAEFPDGPSGYINKAVLYAQAVDKNLNL